MAAMPAPVAGGHVWGDAYTSRVLCSGELPSESVFDWFPVSAFKVAFRMPYVDTEPVSAAPLKPGDEHGFRLTFESVPDNWNMQMPEVRVIHAGLEP